MSSEWKEHGCTIKLSGDKRFSVVELDRAFDTYVAASAAARTYEKNKKKEDPMALACVDEEGTSRTITGVHLAHFNLLVKPTIKKFIHNEAFYADRPDVRVLLQELREVENHAKFLKLCLRNARISHSQYSFHDYGSAVASIKAAHAKAMKAEIDLPELKLTKTSDLKAKTG